jgi:hypothetical protein
MSVTQGERAGSDFDNITTRTQVPLTESSSPVCPSLSPLLPPPSGSPAMANYEVDPTHWLLHGHQIIDSGPARLPRTFYSPSVDPPRRHDNICVVKLLPPPPAPLIPHWRQQVRNFIEDHLQRTVEEVQPCLFGLAFYRLRSPAARAATISDTTGIFC